MPEAIISLVDSRRDRRAFIGFPYRLYRDTPEWTPPLRVDMKHLINTKKNAFYEHGKGGFFIARSSNGEVVGRIAGIVNGMHLKKYNDDVGFFGFFECIDDVDVAAALFKAAGDWLRANGLKAMRGPVNPSLNDTAAVLVSGFERPCAIMLTYNLAYYENLLLHCGFERVATMWSYYTNTRVVNEKRLDRGADIVMKRNPGLSTRHLNMDDYKADMRRMLDIFNDAWSDNWGHVPMTNNEVDQLTTSMKQIVNPNLINIVEDEGEPIGFSVSLPDINYALAKIRDGRLLPFGLIRLLGFVKLDAIRETRMMLMGVKKTHQRKGIDMLIVSDILKRNREVGMLGCDMSWILDQNLQLRNFLDGIGCVREKEYALFEKAIP